MGPMWFAILTKAARAASRCRWSRLFNDVHTAAMTLGTRSLIIEDGRWHSSFTMQNAMGARNSLSPAFSPLPLVGSR